MQKQLCLSWKLRMSGPSPFFPISSLKPVIWTHLFLFAPCYKQRRKSNTRFELLPTPFAELPTYCRHLIYCHKHSRPTFTLRYAKALCISAFLYFFPSLPATHPLCQCHILGFVKTGFCFKIPVSISVRVILANETK